jgi:hypothetical protein
LTDEQVAAFDEKVAALLKEFYELAEENDMAVPNAPIYGLTFAFFPIYRPGEA